MAGIVEKQQAFAQAAAELIQQAHRMGYGVTLGDAFRDARVFGEFGHKAGYGRARSLHKMRLAIDLNLFKDGEYLGSTEAHRPLGEWWEQAYSNHDAAWGGRFNDGNHYSFRLWGSA